MDDDFHSKNKKYHKNYYRDGSSDSWNDRFRERMNSYDSYKQCNKIKRSKSSHSDRTRCEDRYRPDEKLRKYRTANDSISKSSHRSGTSSRNNTSERSGNISSPHRFIPSNGRNHYENSNSHDRISPEYNHFTDRYGNSRRENSRSNGRSFHRNNEKEVSESRSSSIHRDKKTREKKKSLHTNKGKEFSESRSSSIHRDNKSREKKMISSTIVSSAASYAHEETSRIEKMFTASFERHKTEQSYKITHASRTPVLSTSEKINHESSIIPLTIQRSQSYGYPNPIPIVEANLMDSTTSIGIQKASDSRASQVSCVHTSQSRQSVDELSANENVTKFLKEFLNPDNLRALADLLEVSNLIEMQKTLDTADSTESEKNGVPTTPKRGQETEYNHKTLGEGIRPSDADAEIHKRTSSIIEFDEPPTKKAKRSQNKECNTALHTLRPAIENNNVTYNIPKRVIYCPICDERTSSLVSHLINDHPNSEIPTSRLARDVANSLRSSGKILECRRIEKRGTSTKIYNMYLQFCYFCNELKCLRRNLWVNHMAMHTGYYQYQCCNCSEKLFAVNVRRHLCKGDKNVKEVPQPYFRNEILLAYICDICDYVRFNKNEIEKHLESQHHEEDKTSRFTEVPFLKLPTYRSRRKQVEYLEENEIDSKTNDCAQTTMEELKLDILNKTKTLRVQLNRLKNPAEIIQECVSKPVTARKSELAPKIESAEPRRVIKNNNPAFNCSMIRIQCQICKKKLHRSSLVRHYVNSHSESEIIISRLSPDVANYLRNCSQSLKFEIILPQRKCGKRKIKQFCYFCNESKCLERANWIEHMAMHTGYFQSKCIDCSTQFARRRTDHVCKDEKNLETIPQPQFNHKKLMAYICDLCNYVRFNKPEIERHLILQHEENIKSFKNISFLRLSTDIEEEELEGEVEESRNGLEIIVGNSQGCVKDNEEEEPKKPTQGNRSDEEIIENIHETMDDNEEGVLELPTQGNRNDVGIIENILQSMDDNEVEESKEPTEGNRNDGIIENIHQSMKDIEVEGSKEPTQINSNDVGIIENFYQSKDNEVEEPKEPTQGNYNDDVIIENIHQSMDDNEEGVLEVPTQGNRNDVGIIENILQSMDDNEIEEPTQGNRNDGIIENIHQSMKDNEVEGSKEPTQINRNDVGIIENFYQSMKDNEVEEPKEPTQGNHNDDAIIENIHQSIDDNEEGVLEVPTQGNHNDVEIIENVHQSIDNNKERVLEDPAQGNRNDGIIENIYQSMKDIEVEEPKEPTQRNRIDVAIIKNIHQSIDDHEEKELEDPTAENHNDIDITECTQQMEVINAKASNETETEASFVPSSVPFQESHDDYTDDDSWETCSDDSL